MIATHRSFESVPLLRARVFTGAMTALLGYMAMSAVEAQTIRAYTFVPPGEGAWIAMTELAQPEPGPNEVLIDVRAASLNRRDLSIASSGRYRGGDAVGTVALSDGAGEVVAIGASVTRFRVGDRVAGTFFTHWNDGKRTPEILVSARGGLVDGMLAEMVVSHEDNLVAVPEHLSYEEASTLPCAAVTAWRAMFTDGDLQPGEVVLLEGTGGVSIFGLQLAVAAGARTIITSSSDDKLERARALGADGTVNYRTNPDWEEDVLAFTDGRGVDYVLDVGGRDTLPRAVRSLALDGHISIIGGLSGRAVELPLQGIPTGTSVSVPSVGSRADFEAMNRFIGEHQLRPVIDRVFNFEDAAAAFDYMDSNQHFGKIVISL